MTTNDTTTIDCTDLSTDATVIAQLAQHPARLAGRHRQDPRQAPEARACRRRCDRRGGEVR